MAIKARIDTAALKNIAQKLEELKDHPLTQAEAKALGDSIVTEMKDLISKGISPIKGKGRFPAYKNPKTGYPSTVRKQHPDKRNTPVNLRLTGKMLADLKSLVIRRGKLNLPEIGYRSQKEILKEKGHREGANTQPQRPTIPIGNEVFAQRVQDIILRHIRSAIARISRR